MTLDLKCKQKNARECQILSYNLRNNINLFTTCVESKLIVLIWAWNISIYSIACAEKTILLCNYAESYVLQKEAMADMSEWKIKQHTMEFVFTPQINKISAKRMVLQ